MRTFPLIRDSEAPYDAAVGAFLELSMCHRTAALGYNRKWTKVT